MEEPLDYGGPSLGAAVADQVAGFDKVFERINANLAPQLAGFDKVFEWLAERDWFQQARDAAIAELATAPDKYRRSPATGFLVRTALVAAAWSGVPVVGVLTGLSPSASLTDVETQIAAYLAIALAMTFGCFPGVAKWGAQGSNNRSHDVRSGSSDQAQRSCRCHCPALPTTGSQVATDVDSPTR